MLSTNQLDKKTTGVHNGMKRMTKILTVLTALSLSFSACESDSGMSEDEVITKALEPLSNSLMYAVETSIMQKKSTTLDYSGTVIMDYSEAGFTTEGSITYSVYLEYGDTSYDIHSSDIELFSNYTSNYNNYQNGGLTVDGIITVSYEMMGSANYQSTNPISDASGTTTLTLNGSLLVTGDETATIAFNDFTFNITINNNSENAETSGSVLYNGELINTDDIQIGDTESE